MAREKNGWIKLHSSILYRDFSLVEYKVFTGLLLLANSRKHNSPGLVDLSLRDMASRLKVSIGALKETRDKFEKDGRIEIIPTKRDKAKPIMAIRITNYDYYQGNESVSSYEHSTEGCSPSDTKNVHKMTQKISPSEHTVSPSEHSRIQKDTPKKHKETKEYYYKNRGDGDGVHRRSVRPVPKAHEYKRPDEY